MGLGAGSFLPSSSSSSSACSVILCYDKQHLVIGHLQGDSCAEPIFANSDRLWWQAIAIAPVRCHRLLSEVYLEGVSSYREPLLVQHTQSEHTGQHPFG
jgi:hypothetical protein